MPRKHCLLHDTDFRKIKLVLFFRSSFNSRCFSQRRRQLVGLFSALIIYEDVTVTLTYLISYLSYLEPRPPAGSRVEDCRTFDAVRWVDGLACDRERWAVDSSANRPDPRYSGTTTRGG